MGSGGNKKLKRDKTLQHRRLLTQDQTRLGMSVFFWRYQRRSLGLKLNEVVWKERCRCGNERVHRREIKFLFVILYAASNDQAGEALTLLCWGRMHVNTNSAKRV